MAKAIEIRIALSLFLAAGLFLTVASRPQATQSPNNAGKPEVVVGQSVTLLPDGRLLFIGGEGADGVLATARVQNPTTGITVQLASQLHQARAWHTATLLPDGNVLVVGGIGAAGEIVTLAELLNTETGVFVPVEGADLTPRAHHTATVLTDGIVLIAGGVSASGETLNQAETWNWSSGTATPLQAGLLSERKGHSSTLLGDGSVMLWAGTNKHGQQLNFGEAYDPTTQAFRMQGSPLSVPRNQPPQLEESIPDNGADDVPIDAVFSLRFSKPLDVTTINPTTLTLSGPEHAVPIGVVPTEDGMLAFITPQQTLQPRTSYSLTVDGPRDANSRTVPHRRITFTTASQPAGGFPGDNEEWVPGPPNFEGDWRSNRPPSPWSELPPLQAPEGVTALAGQVLKLNGQPLQGVTLKIDEGGVVMTQTDETGRFLLAPLPAGWHELWIIGTTANQPGKTYGVFVAGVGVYEGKTNVLDYTIWMPRIDTAHAVTIPSPTTAETVVTSPLLPGLELRLPPKARIYDHDGKPVTEVSITPIPHDQPPFPLPVGVEVPIYFTIQPGGAYIHTYGAQKQGARLIYPNLRRAEPGTRFEFWNYDPKKKGWYIYGNGTVTSDGRQIVPDPGVVIYEFTGAMVASPTLAPATGWKPDQCGSLADDRDPVGCGGLGEDGDPVDSGTGLFVHRNIDLSLPGVIPITFTRTYRNEDSRSRPFGIGATHNYEIFLVGNVAPYTWQELILPDGGRIHYDRISPGWDSGSAVYEHVSTPTRFYGSRISWNGNGWDLKLKDGTVFVFGDGLLSPSPATIGMRDRNGNVLTLIRDSQGQLIKILSPSGRWIEFTYDSSKRITQAKDNSGRVVMYEYDASARLWKVTNPAGGVTEYTYDSSHRMLTIKNPRGIVKVTNEYTNGRVTKQTLANGKTYLFNYTLDGGGQITQTDVTDPRGNVRRLAFNSAGYIVSNTYALGTSVQRTFTYERQAGSNLVLSVTDPLNRVTAHTYDSLGNRTSTTRLAGTPEAVTTSFTYEPSFNELASITDPLNHTTPFTYDTDGDLVKITDPLNHETQFAHNTAGQQVSATDPLNNTALFEYSSGDLTSVADPLGRTTTRFTGSTGQLVSNASPLGETAQYEYDLLDRLIRVTDPLGGVTSFSYDPNGNLLSVADAHNNTTSYAYDNMDRLTTRTDPLLQIETYEYDEVGNLTRFIDRRGKISQFTYDALNRKTFAGFGWNGTSYESTITYTYDAGNRLAQVVDSLSGTITRSYDGLNRLLSETTPQGTVSYAYDAVGRRTTMNVSGQQQVSYSYDNADRLTQITQGSSVVSLSYDAANRRTSLTLPNGVVMAYSYDAASQLTGITYSLGQTTLGTLTYAYDQSSRRAQAGGSFARTGLPQPLATATFNAANRLTQWGAGTLNYDANGNLSSDGANTYTWDARDRLVTISGGISASFQYDALGRRVSRTVNGATRSFLYDGANIVQEQLGGGQIGNLLTGLGVDEHLVRTDPGWTQYFLSDALGSTLALADSSGSVLTQYTYEPFGQTNVTGAPAPQSFQYTGRENDETALYYHRARYYSPLMARFVSEDPLGFAAGINFYVYAENSPLQFKDPFGLSPWDCIKCFFSNYDECAKKATECRRRIDEEYGGDAVAICSAANSPYLSTSYFKLCFANDPVCQKTIRTCGKCGLFPPAYGDPNFNYPIPK